MDQLNGLKIVPKKAAQHRVRVSQYEYVEVPFFVKDFVEGASYTIVTFKGQRNAKRARKALLPPQWAKFKSRREEAFKTLPCHRIRDQFVFSLDYFYMSRNFNSRSYPLVGSVKMKRPEIRNSKFDLMKDKLNLCSSLVADEPSFTYKSSGKSLAMQEMHTVRPEVFQKKPTVNRLKFFRKRANELSQAWKERKVKIHIFNLIFKYFIS